MNSRLTRMTRRSTRSRQSLDRLLPAQSERRLDLLMTNQPSATAQSLRVAQLTSSIGAGVLGIGLGSITSHWIDSLGIPVLVVGLVMHAVGMATQHRLERREGQARPWWSTLLYWLRWASLALLTSLIVLRAFR